MINTEISINGRSYPWGNMELYDRLMGCYPSETGLKYGSNTSQKILAILYTTSPELCPYEFLAKNIFGLYDQSTRAALWTEVFRAKEALKASNLGGQIALYTVTGKGY